VPRDQIHRVVREKPVHRRTFRRGLIGHALAILRGNGNHGRLNDGRQHRAGIKLPDRQLEPRARERVQHLDGNNREQHEGRSRGGPQHGRTSAGQRRLGRNQSEPDDQRRVHPARQRNEISDQRGKDRQRSRFERRQRKAREGEKRQDSRRQEARDGDGLADVGPSHQRHERQRETRADARLRSLHRDEAPAAAFFLDTGHRNRADPHH
jgi:hypothetical protein